MSCALIVTKGLRKPPELFAQSPWLPGQRLSPNFTVAMDYLKLKIIYLVELGLAGMIASDGQCYGEYVGCSLIIHIFFHAQRPPIL